jgi:hypothetical protein
MPALMSLGERHMMNRKDERITPVFDIGDNRLIGVRAVFGSVIKSFKTRREAAEWLAKMDAKAA